VQEGLQFVVQFEDELKNLQAISGATETQLASLSDTIVDVASQSKFSTLEITKAATTLAQAGFSTSDMEKSLAAVTGLAAASGSSPAEAVDVLTSSISAFNLQTSEASRVSDVLVAALNRSKLTIEQVRLAIQYVGATAYEQNISLEQLVATAGALANAGVRSGSTIGTGLRQLLVDLQNPSEKLLEQFNRLNISLADVDVKTRGFPAVLQTLTDKGFGAAQAYGALETRAAAAYLVLRNQQDTLGDLLVAVARQGAAAEANAKAMDSLSAQWTRFTNILSTSASGALQDTVDFLKSVLTIAGDGIQKIKDLREEASKSGVAEQVQQYSLPGPLDALSALNKALLTVADSGVIAGRELGLLDQNTRGWGERWIAYSDSVSGSSANLDDLSTATKDATEQLDAQQQTVSSLDQEIARLLLQQNSIANNQRLVQAETITLTSRFEGLAVQLGTTENKFYDLVNALRAYRKEQREALGTALQGQINAVTLERDSLNRQGGQQIRAIRTSNEYGLLKPAERAALNNPTRDANAAILTDAANRLIKSNPTIARQLLGLSTTAGRFVELGVQQRGAQEALSFNRAATSNYGQQASNFFEGVQARIGQITPQATGKEPGERKALFNAPIADLDRFDRELERKLNAGGLREGDREFIEDLRQQVASAKAGVQALVDPTSAEQKASDRAANKAAGAARRAQNKALSNDQFLERSQLKTAELDIKDALEDVAQASALAIYDEGREAAMAALDRWVDERNQLADAEIAKRGLGGEQAELYRREVAEEIRAKTDQVVRALNDGFRKYIDAQVDQINREFDQALQPTQRALGIAEGLRSGLDRESLNGKVPDYVRQLADRRAGLARDEADRAAIPANEARIARLQQLANDTRARIEVAKGEGASTAEVATLNIEVEKLTQQIDELSVANDNLKASFHSETLIPPTLGASLRSAIDAYAQANGVNNTFAENLKNNLGGAVAAVGEGFRGFFSSIISGSQSAGGAFMGFVKSVIRALEELLAQQLALMLLKQIFSMFGSSFGGSTSTSLSAGTAGGGSIGGASGASFMPTTLRYRGGPITGYDTGGLVRNGVPNRDSVNAKLAKGEFVLRKSAVDSLGAEFVSDLNRRGKMAIEGLKKMPTVVQQMPKQEMAVYVVAPEQRPSLTPNDVLVTIQEDILKDGTTKKLIKHVSQGG
jgi:TP901 family phage tail tape measure protein